MTTRDDEIRWPAAFLLGVLAVVSAAFVLGMNYIALHAGCSP